MVPLLSECAGFLLQVVVFSHSGNVVLILSAVGVSAGKRIPRPATRPVRVSSLTPAGSVVVVGKIVKKETDKGAGGFLRDENEPQIHPPPKETWGRFGGIRFCRLGPNLDPFSAFSKWHE
jgi:hypothetical protein